MHQNHLLQLNVRKTIRCLDSILSAGELAKIEAELKNNVRQLIRLGQAHLRFAKQASGSLSWRQRVSRGYYGAYSASKAIRLEVNGIYNIDLKDHQKIGDLPGDFKAATRWRDFLTKFRADRNLADYDHSVSEKALELPSVKYLAQAE